MRSHYLLDFDLRKSRFVFVPVVLRPRRGLGQASPSLEAPRL